MGLNQFFYESSSQVFNECFIKQDAYASVTVANVPVYICRYIYNYIHNWFYNPSARIIDLVSHTTYIVCVNFIHKWRNLQFKVDSERQIFGETFHRIFIYSKSFWKKSAERKSPKKYFLHFVLMSGLGLEPWLYVYQANTVPTRLRRLQHI